MYMSFSLSLCNISSCLHWRNSTPSCASSIYKVKLRQLNLRSTGRSSGPVRYGGNHWVEASRWNRIQ